MNLTENEKKILKKILNNSRITDSQMASEIKISSVAVGKIRKKLESSVIESYSVNLNYAKLGIQVFAVTIAKLTEKAFEKGQLEVEQFLLKTPQIITIYRLPQASSTHIIMYGFKDLNELDTFFHSFKYKQKLHNFVDIKELFTFSHNGLIKNNPMQLFCQMIDNQKKKSNKFKFNEIQKFKKRLQ
jgi:DNA-binding Lrp family transcriptional regulator